MSLNLALKAEIVRKFGTQLAASRRLGIRESRLSHLVRGHDMPTPKERAKLARALGQNFLTE